MKKKRPYLAFFVDNWLADPGLRSCSPGARGIWMDMLCVMHLSPKYGHLVMPNCKPASIANLCVICGAPEALISMHLAELEGACVLSKLVDGTIYCRKMVRDEEERASWRERKEEYRSSKNVYTDLELHKNSCKSNKSETNAVCPPVSIPNSIPNTKELQKQKHVADATDSHPLSTIWQERHGLLPAILGLTPKRLNKCRERMRHAGDPERFLADFAQAVEQAQSSSFLTGGTGTWKASFDWFTANDENYRKVLEGNYVDQNKGANGNGISKVGAGPSAAERGIRVKPETLARIEARERLLQCDQAAKL